MTRFWAALGLAALLVAGCGDPPIAVVATKKEPAVLPSDTSESPINTNPIQSDKPKPPYVFKVLTNSRVKPLSLYHFDPAKNGARPANALASTPLVIRDASIELKQSQVTAYLKHEHIAGKNLLWCATMQLAWNEFSDTFGNPLRLSGNPPIADHLNERLSSSDDLDKGSYIARGGLHQDVDREVRALLAAKFPTAPQPELLQPAPEAGPDVMRFQFYAYLFKQLKFKHSFIAFHTHLNFGGAHIQGFGLSSEIEESAWAKIASHATVWHRSDSDFAVELAAEDKHDRLIFSCIPPGATLLDTIDATLARLAEPPSPALLYNERLEIPMMNFDLHHNYDELKNRSVLNIPQANGIDRAVQRIKLELNEKGATLVSEVVLETWVVANGEESPRVKPRHFIFNKPFLMLLIRKDAKRPYFAFWVDNAELLVPAKPSAKP